jgi:8-oxo-dGTP pyrophosphatase MutT (NUDIX family)
MATTAVVAEILIVGLQATAWVTLLLLTIFGTDWVDSGALSDFAALTTIGVLAGAYVLGIVVDRAADSFFSWLRKKRLGKSLNGRFGESSNERRLPAGVSTMRLTAMREGGALAAFLEYQRSRLRVIRGTAMNLAIGTPVLFAFLWRNAEPWHAFVGAGFLLAGLAASVPAAERIRSAHLDRLVDAYGLIVPAKKEKKEKNRDVVAAVTYGAVEGEPRLLLVRTSKGDRWTFPKGKVEKGESGPQAARREAREEAGVEGAIEEQPFTSYRYPTKRGEYEVAAYLLRADPGARLSPAEAVRKPEWVSPAEARERLRHGREAVYGGEHERVLDEALARIAPLDADRG